MESALFLVRTPIGNRADITDRARQVLRDVHVVYAEDTRRTGRLLGWLGSEARLRSLHEHNEAGRIAEILDLLENDRSCALVSDAGTPVISDPGARLVAAVLEGGGRVVPVPGASAVAAALAASGFPADRFAFLGFPPRRPSDRKAWVGLLARLPMTLVAFESPRRIGGLLNELAAAGLSERRCVICRELTKLHETIRRGTVAELAPEFGEETRGEITVVLEAAEESAEWEDRLDVIEREARRLGERGLSTRDIGAKLVEAFGVPRNVAYDLGLRFGRSEDGS